MTAPDHAAVRENEALRAEVAAILQEAAAEREEDMAAMLDQVDALVAVARGNARRYGIGLGCIFASAVTNAGWLFFHWMGWLP